MAGISMSQDQTLRHIADTANEALTTVSPAYTREELVAALQQIRGRARAAYTLGARRPHQSPLTP